jgi:tetratricopeptide (TPR) repeat protein
LVDAQERFVHQPAERDRAYAQEIAVFRRAVQDIASTPEGEAALRQYNAGDEAGALAVLDRLVDARGRGRQVRANVETAAERRRVAALALDANSKGRVRADAVIARYEEVVRLDPDVALDWIELGRLYTEAGRLSDAKRGALKAVGVAKDLPRFIGIDLKNEPHGAATWAFGNAVTDWNRAAERAAAAVLAANSELLIFVEGVQENPVCSSRTNRRRDRLPAGGLGRGQSVLPARQRLL